MCSRDTSERCWLASGSLPASTSPAVAIELRLGDMMQADEALAAATHVYIKLALQPQYDAEARGAAGLSTQPRMVASLQLPAERKWNLSNAQQGARSDELGRLRQGRCRPRNSCVLQAGVV